MKLASTICRYLLGLVFTIFGANGFLHFIAQPPPATQLGIQFMTATFTSHYMVLIFLLQLVAGILLLVGRFVPLALVVLAGIIINILNYHITMDPGAIGPGVVATILWFVTAQSFRSSFRGLFVAKPEPAAG